jgi:hypothetical protein
MFRLLKLMAFALFGYAVYEFFRGMSDGGGMRGMGGGMQGGQRSMSGGGFGSESFGQMTGAGEGREESTLETDGGSVRHRVGRGAATM